MGKRKIGTGVYRVLRFNWHFYVIAAAVFGVLLGIIRGGNGWLHTLALVVLVTGMIMVTLSFLITLYVYDLSGLYQLEWLDQLALPRPATILNIHAGYDETSLLLAEKYPDAALTMMDFYDPGKHTELSIKRARKLYPHVPGTIPIHSEKIPLDDGGTDLVFLIFAAHEIRDDDERVRFFKECLRVLAPDGRIIVVEHLRDLPNALAYNLGAFHFHHADTWRTTFKRAGADLRSRIRINPFVTLFMLGKYGNTP